MFRKVHLSNGIPLVMERMSSFRSVSLGIWVSSGSRHESVEDNGISHFLEHMFFKGTATRTARDIAVFIDSIGGELNAFTSKEGTTFYIKVLDEHLRKGIDIITDIYLNSEFPQEEIEREAGVVVEEIHMVEDVPEDYVHELFPVSIWGNSGLGQTVIGKAENVTRFSRQDLFNRVMGHYGTNNTIIACAGNFDEDMLVAALNAGIGRLDRKGAALSIQTPVFDAPVGVHAKDIAEAQICLGLEGIRQSSPERYDLLLLNTILGGGISSRLFQEIREKRGLAYSVYSFISSYVDTGFWAVYAGTGKDKVPEVIDTTVREIRALEASVTEEELLRAKDQIKGSIMLGLESTSRRMQNIANQEIYYGRYFPPAEIISNIDAVTLKNIRSLAGRLIAGKKIALTVLGPLDASDVDIP